MKKLAWGVALGVLGLALTAQAARKMSFGTVEPVNTQSVFELPQLSREALETAMDVHNMMVEVRRLKTDRTEVESATRIQNLHERQMAAMDKCSARKLADQFKNPEEVWQKMKDAYRDRERELTVYVNAAENMTPEELEAYNEARANGEMNEEMLAEMMAQWRLGQEILTDVYANQDKWGERKDKQAPSFPLWRDQQYQFNQDWDAYYTKLNAYLGAPANGRPEIDEVIRSDYARRADVMQAHQAYLKRVSQQNPARARQLPDALKEPPAAPHPLPPKKELLAYFRDDTVGGRVYPALPEPWQRYADDGYKDVNPDGEMAADFDADHHLTEKALAEDQTNRLVVAAGIQQSLDGATRMKKMVDEGVSETIDGIRAELATYITLGDNENLLDPDVQASVLQRLKVKKEALLAQAEQDFQKYPKSMKTDRVVQDYKLDEIEDFTELKKINPAAFEALQSQMPVSVYQQDKDLLEALKADADGWAFLNEANAAYASVLIKDAHAREAFSDELDAWKDSVVAAESVAIDDDCLNGGV